MASCQTTAKGEINIKSLLLFITVALFLGGCSVRDESADIAHCRNNASQRVAKDARAVDATYKLCESAKAQKRHAEENKDTAVAIATFIADILN
ncbi:hypothetical protein [Alteromonas sp. H39]|uniref:hypothetical protein n=1 Tax=Alteromonas sp. H39 TaxID=3389876 RepID=UPI0039DF4AB0